jgi:hypothetical protein
MSEKNKRHNEHYSERFFSPNRKNNLQTPFGLMFKEQMPGTHNAEAGISHQPCPTQQMNTPDTSIDFDWTFS